MKRMATLICLLAVMIICANIVQAETLIVPRQYPTIQAAVNAAQPGDTVLVLSGTYEISAPITVNMDISIISAEGAENTIIVLTTLPNGAAFSFGTGLTRDALLQGFTITNVYGTMLDGVEIWNNSSPTIRNNILSAIYSGPVMNGGYGIRVWGYPVVTSQALIENNVITGFNYGISYGINSGQLQGCPKIINNTIVGNFYGIKGNGPMKIKNCIIYNNVSSNIFGGNVPVITYSDVGGGYPGEGNIDANPLFVGGNDFHLQPGSPCIDAGDPSPIFNDPNGTRNDMGTYGGRFAQP